MLAEVLLSSGPAPDRADALTLYGQFVGSWDGTVRWIDADGEWREASAEVHFDWALEGRAVQDVWIVPARSDGPAAMYGTTVRVYDPQTDQWGITWIDPLRGDFNRMDGRRIGDEIVQQYQANGVRHEWRFTEITDSSFHWISRESRDDGTTWAKKGEYFLRRRAG